MQKLVTYDLMETARNTNEWLGASARAAASYPAFGLVANPLVQLMAAWGEVTERSFSRMTDKPDWGIDAITGADGRDHLVAVRTVQERPFGDLVHFEVSGRAPMARRVLLVAPMSGHYATLLRSTVRSLLPDCEVFITDWRNARDIPVSCGKFDVEDYTLYLADFVRALGPDIHVVAVCQPVPLALAATAWLAEHEPAAQPATLTLIGGPVDPDAAPSEVTDFGRRVTMGQLERSIIQRVGFKHAGAGRLVYPGLLQLASFMSMNAERHTKAFAEQVLRVAKGEASDHDRHNRFYDEYLAVMDMTAEFYLSTVERVFKGREIGRNAFTLEGRPVDLGRIAECSRHGGGGGGRRHLRPRPVPRGARPAHRPARGAQDGASGAGRGPLRHLRRRLLAAQHPPAGAALHRRRRRGRGGRERGQGPSHDQAEAPRPQAEVGMGPPGGRADPGLGAEGSGAGLRARDLGG